MTNDTSLSHFDEWLAPTSDAAALVLREWLEPAEGKDATVFPPTYPVRDKDQKESRAGYNIDRFEDCASICQLDSVGSQANRSEPLFGRERYRSLVPQVAIRAKVSGKERTIQLLEAGHRGADAIVRFSTLGPAIHEAFAAFQDGGQAEALARIAPTSIVYGSWDSRATQAKFPRIVRSVIKAYDVRELRRSAQYATVAGNILESGDAEVATEGPKAELGLAHVPAVHSPGGIRVLGEIRRDAILKIETLRALSAERDENSLKLRRYLLGLSLVAFTAPPKTFLREGCELVMDPTKTTLVKLVHFDGRRQEFSLSHDEALTYAQTAAADFGVRIEAVEGVFDNQLAIDIQKLSKDQRRQLLKQGPVTADAIRKVAAGKKGAGAAAKAEEN